MIVRYSGPATLRANQLFTAVLEITLEEPVDTGGRIAIAFRHVSDFGDAQDADPAAENYISAEVSSADVELALNTEQPWYRHPWNQGFDLVLARGSLAPGDVVRVRLGGEAGYRAQSFVEDVSRIRVGVMSQGGAPIDGAWIVSEPERSPTFEIVGAEPSQLRLRVPDVNREAAMGSVCLKMEDAHGNPTDPAGAEVALLLDDAHPVGRLRLSAPMAEFTDIPLPADGEWHRLTAASDDGRYLTRSNPFGPSLLEGYQLYWGEIHAQSALCDGTNSPAALYRYGREAAGLDFASVTSHDMEMTPDDWSEVQRATREAHRSGTYVTFLGYEWSGPTQAGGDHNVYYLDDEGPMLPNGPCFSRAEWCPANKYIERKRTILDVAHELPPERAFIVPHCGGRIANFDYFEPQMMPVFEIHSCHRNFEDVAQEALRRGLHVGFIGGSDDHRGGLGDSVPAARDRFFSTRNGLAAVYARDLTRESLWEAIYARRVYATNGCRPALAFSANGVFMGGQVRVAIGEPVQFTFDVVLDGTFDHAALVRCDREVARFSKNHNQIGRYTGQYEERAAEGSTPYYLRAHQADGGIAWSSPIWVVAVGGSPSKR